MPRQQVDPRIRTALNVVAVPLPELRQWDRNPHTGNVEAIRASLRRFGQVEPIVRAPDGWIIAGNHTLKALEEESYSHAACVTLDAEQAEQFAYALASNRTAQLGSDDDISILALLREIDVLEGTGYDQDDREDLEAAVAELERASLNEPGRYSLSDAEREQGVRSDEPSFNERMEGYQGNGVRSVVLDYDLDQFAWFVAQAALAREQCSVETNTDLVLELLSRHTGVPVPAPRANVPA